METWEVCPRVPLLWTVIPNCIQGSAVMHNDWYIHQANKCNRDRNGSITLRKMSFYIRDEILQNYTNQQSQHGWEVNTFVFVYLSQISLSSSSLHRYQATNIPCGPTLLLTAFASPGQRIHMHPIPSESCLSYVIRVSIWWSVHWPMSTYLSRVA